MKTILLALFCVLCAQGAWAQDLIVKRNGEEISAKILEITPDVIQYKRFDYQDSPLISIAKKEVFMIKYANGSKEVITTTLSPAPITFNNVDPTLGQEAIKLGGPRLGFTAIGGTLADELKEDHNLNPFLTQFGWQFETRLFTTSKGLTGLAEFVPLVGGLEQGAFLPSLSALVGLRGAKGFEFGVGPNVSPAGAGLVFALGTNLQSEGINFPINLAVVPSRDGVRASVLFGFNSRKN
ncbi:hypothetical protein GU926_03750 [Nibribacter ruber]|uniref:Uncharacterized protein n=1 Tax=Nibribacter ruber TaxID=2698458 RepID=A0A6P1NU77_9BACT|nr:hypothetical protein [Nibribacter ruber]QHL86600.1 hypothetical protein GU926_03750 [Nibribacter ruber]